MNVLSCRIFGGISIIWSSSEGMSHFGKQNGKSVKKDTIQEILYTIPFIKGVEECISFLKEHHIHTAIVSAGLDILAEKVAMTLGLIMSYANEVKVGKDGRLTGESVLHVELMHKDKNVKALAQETSSSLGCMCGSREFVL